MYDIRQARFYPLTARNRLARVHFTFGARLEIIGKNEDKGANNEKKPGRDESGVDEASRGDH